MKKIIALALAVLMTAVLMVGCAGTPDFKDGTYKATNMNASHGWTDYLEVTVEGGKIVAVDYDSLDADGNRKSESQDYEDNMKGAGYDVGPIEFYPEYEQKLLDNQTADVDAVAGATTSGNSMKTLFDQLRKNMVNGDTTEVMVDNNVD